MNMQRIKQTSAKLLFLALTILAACTADEQVPDAKKGDPICFYTDSEDMVTRASGFIGVYRRLSLFSVCNKQWKAILHRRTICI